MTQSNEMPDVLYAYRVSSGGFGCTGESAYSQAKGVTTYTRNGAPSPWIDPKVQPIPEGLDDSARLYAKTICRKRGFSYSTEMRGECSAGLAREFHVRGELFGYIILPECK